MRFYCYVVNVEFAAGRGKHDRDDRGKREDLGDVDLVESNQTPDPHTSRFFPARIAFVPPLTSSKALGFSPGTPVQNPGSILSLVDRFNQLYAKFLVLIRY